MQFICLIKISNFLAGIYW